MFQIEISRSVPLTFFITVLAIALGVQKCCCAGSLVTTPPAVDGVLTSCGEAWLTCSHDNVAGETTRWRITSGDSSFVCQAIINHVTPPPDPRCNEFTLEDIDPCTSRAFELHCCGQFSTGTFWVSVDPRWSVLQVDSQLHLQLAVSHSVL